MLLTFLLMAKLNGITPKGGIANAQAKVCGRLPL